MRLSDVKMRSNAAALVKTARRSRREVQKLLRELRRVKKPQVA